MESTVSKKSFAFAVRIVNLAKYLQKGEATSLLNDGVELERMLISILKTLKLNAE